VAGLGRIQQHCESELDLSWTENKIPSDAKEKAEKEELLLRIDKLEQEIKALKTENTLLNDKLNKIKEIVG